MEKFDAQTIRKAYALHQELMVNGRVHRKRNPELYHAYFEVEVRTLLTNVFLPEARAEILTQDEVLYFVPEMENELFAYSNEALRNEIGLANNKQLYLAQFIYINVLSEFYGEQYHTINEPLSFVKLEDLVTKIRNYMKKFSKWEEEDLFALSTEYDLNIIGMLEAWDQLTEETGDLKQLSKASGRVRGFILKVLRFWVKEQLIVIQEEEEISLTEKMKGIAGNYYNHSDRIAKIKELLEEKTKKGEIKYA